MSFKPLIENLNAAVVETNRIIILNSAITKAKMGQKLSLEENIKLEAELTKNAEKYAGSNSVSDHVLLSRLASIRKEIDDQKRILAITISKEMLEKSLALAAQEVAKSNEVSKGIIEKTLPIQSQINIYESQRNELIKQRIKIQNGESDVLEKIVDELEQIVWKHTDLTDSNDFMLDFLVMENKELNNQSDEISRLLALREEGYVLSEDEAALIDSMGIYVENLTNGWTGFNDELEVSKINFGELIQEAKKLADGVSEVWDSATRTFSAYSDLVNNQNDATIKALEDEIKARKANGEDTVALEQKLKDKKNEFAKDAFEGKQMSATAEAAVQGALAIIKGYAELGPIGGSIAAGFIGALTAAQIGMINAQSYVPMAQGGIVTGPTNALLGENGPEMVIPLRGGNKMGGGGVTVIQNIAGSVLTEKYLTNQTIKAMRYANRGY
jgi:hypothetical protein